MDLEREDLFLLGIIVLMGGAVIYPHINLGEPSPVVKQCRSEAAAVEQLERFQEYGASCDCIPPDQVPDPLTDSTRSARLVENRTVSLYFIHCTYENEDAPLFNYYPVRKIVNGSSVLNGQNATVLNETATQ